jgi:hypothetical protein
MTMVPPEGLIVLYDLRDSAAWHQAHQHRRLWGQRFTDVIVVDLDHIALVFRTGGARWRAWEKRRLRLIVGEAEAA